MDWRGSLSFAEIGGWTDGLTLNSFGGACRRQPVTHGEGVECGEDRRHECRDKVGVIRLRIWRMLIEIL